MGQATTLGRVRLIALAALLFGAPGFTHAGELKGKVVGASESSPAVVWIDGVPAATVPKQDTVITHVKGSFQPFLSVGFVGNDFVLRNDDDVMHNTHLYMRLAYQKAKSSRPLMFGATLYNVALPKAGVQVKKPIVPYHRYREDTGFVEVVCNRHAEERAYVLVFDHPYAVITDKQGNFTIPDVPPGKHEVKIWRAGEVTTWNVVDIKDGGPTEVVIEQG